MVWEWNRRFVVFLLDLALQISMSLGVFYYASPNHSVPETLHRYEILFHFILSSPSWPSSSSSLFHPTDIAQLSHSIRVHKFYYFFALDELIEFLIRPPSPNVTLLYWTNYVLYETFLLNLLRGSFSVAANFHGSDPLVKTGLIKLSYTLGFILLSISLIEFIVNQRTPK